LLQGGSLKPIGSKAALLQRGLFVRTALYVLVSLRTTPLKKAEIFVGCLDMALSRRNFV